MNNRLSLDTCRCRGSRCAIKESCLRHTDKPIGGMRVPYTDNLCIVLVAPMGWINDRKYYMPEGEQDAL
jgi:hypothetical protein